MAFSRQPRCAGASASPSGCACSSRPPTCTGAATRAWRRSSTRRGGTEQSCTCTWSRPSARRTSPAGATGRSAIGHLAHLGCLRPGPHPRPRHLGRRGGSRSFLADTACLVSPHNASSGLRLASGIAPLTEMTKRGIPVALGIDQSNIDDNRNMLTEMGLVWALHRAPGCGTAPVAGRRAAHGHRARGRDHRLCRHVGRLDPGLAADIVLLDWKPGGRPSSTRARRSQMRWCCGRARRRSTPSSSAAASGGAGQGGLDRPRCCNVRDRRPARGRADDGGGARPCHGRSLMPHLEAWFAPGQRIRRRPYRYNGFAGP